VLSFVLQAILHKKFLSPAFDIPAKYVQKNSTDIQGCEQSETAGFLCLLHTG
jgi:hypothetical protein